MRRGLVCLALPSCMSACMSDCISCFVVIRPTRSTQCVQPNAFSKAGSWGLIGLTGVLGALYLLVALTQ